MSTLAKSHKELRVYQNAFNAAMEIFRLTKHFPPEERFSLVDQIRRSSRSVCSNISEAWRKRRYKAAFIAKLSDAETEACETQVHLEFSKECGYINIETYSHLCNRYEQVISQIVLMIDAADRWVISAKRQPKK